MRKFLRRVLASLYRFVHYFDTLKLKDSVIFKNSVHEIKAMNDVLDAWTIGLTEGTNYREERRVNWCAMEEALYVRTDIREYGEVVFTGTRCEEAI